MLIILSEGQYDAFKKSGQKPSEFCKKVLRYRNVKTHDFVKTYFSKPAALTEANSEIRNGLEDFRKGEGTLRDLLRD